MAIPQGRWGVDAQGAASMPEGGRAGATAPHPVYDQFLSLLPERALTLLARVPEERASGCALMPVTTQKEAADVAFALICAVDAASEDIPVPPAWERARCLLVEACLLLLSTWFPEGDCTFEGLFTLLNMEAEGSVKSPLRLMFDEIEVGERYASPAMVHDGKKLKAGRFRWMPSRFVRNTDGRRSADVVGGVQGLGEDEDAALGAYRAFLRACPASCRRQLAILTVEAFAPLGREVGWRADAPIEDADLMEETHRILGLGRMDALDTLSAEAMLQHIVAAGSGRESAAKFKSLLRERLKCAMSADGQEGESGEGALS